MPPAKVIYASDPIIETLRSEPQPARVIAIAGRGPTPERDAFLTG